MSVSGLKLPLKQFVEQTVAAAVDKLGLEKPDAVVEKLGVRWHGGKLVLHRPIRRCKPRKSRSKLFSTKS